MNSEQIIKSDVLDILFENRNKSYGAYHLRKFYNDRMYKALGGMLVAVAVFAAFAFISPSKAKINAEAYKDSVTTVMTTLAKPKPKVDLPTPPAAAPRVPQAMFLSNIAIVQNVPDSVRTITAAIAISSVNVIDTTIGKPVVVVGSPIGTGDPGPVTPDPPVVVEPVFKPEVPIDNPDVEPQFPGGMEKLRKYLQNNLTNPRDMEAGEKVRVVVKFVVGYDGKLKAFETLQDGGSEFNREVMRVLKRMPEWTPGKANGKNVSVFFTLPVVFTPDEE